MTTDHYYCPECFWTLTELEYLRLRNGMDCPRCGDTVLNDYRIVTHDPIEHEQEADNE